MVGGFATRASAQCTPNAGPFCIDGVITSTNNSGVAPQALFTPDPSGTKEFGPINGSPTKVGVINFATPPPTILGDTTMPSKVDLTGVYTQAALSGTDFWFYYAWNRASTAGSGFMAVEFERAAKPTVCSVNYDPFNPTALLGCNPWANRNGDGTPQNSDFMILWDQQGNTFGLQNIFVRFYNKSAAAFGPAQPLGAAQAVAVYGGNGTDPSKGEMALNFSSIVGVGANQCLTFANIIPNTVTGNSDTADYKDTVLSNFPIASSCGTVTVKKITSPATTGINFQYTLADGSPMFGVANPDPDCTETGSNVNTCVGLLAHNETDTISDLLHSNNYTLVESVVATNFQLASIICTPEGGSAINVTAAGSTFPVQATKTTACVITNNQLMADLKIIKIVNNNFGLTKQPGDFSFTRDGGAAEPFANSGVSCTSGAVCKTISYAVGASFVVDEPLAGIPTGYTLVSKVGCSGTISASGNTCTITNQDTINAATVFTRMKVILHDRATVGGIRRGVGEGASTLTFRLYSDASCTTQVFTETFNIVFNTATEDTKSFATTSGYTVEYNAAVDPALVSGYRWRAFYSGNTFNSAQSTACGDENITLTAFQK